MYQHPSHINFNISINILGRKLQTKTYSSTYYKTGHTTYHDPRDTRSDDSKNIFDGMKLLKAYI